MSESQMYCSYTCTTYYLIRPILCDIYVSQFPRSLFPQFTEQQLEEASKNFKSSDGEPFVEHDEVINDLKLENGSGSQRRPAGTGRSDVDNSRERRHEISSHHKPKPPEAFGLCIVIVLEIGKVREFRIVNKATGEVELIGRKIGSYNIVPKESLKALPWRKSVESEDVYRCKTKSSLCPSCETNYKENIVGEYKKKGAESSYNLRCIYRTRG
ncbi:15077_t:CDS:2, partial [Rhizophagus irregularis]